MSSFSGPLPGSSVGFGALLRPLLLGLGLSVLLLAAPLTPVAAAADGKLVLVLDSSGSMQDKIDGGRKITVAKRALNAVVDRLPDGAQVGLRVYGARVDDEDDPAACTDSQLVVPIGPADKPALKEQIARYRPLGETPISYSLEQAAKDLGASGRRTVVLVSDGKESCGEDPCVTAGNLAERGIDLKVDVVGLAVTGAARSQLRCIADKGRGTYYDAKNAEQIEDSLDKLATRAFRPFQLTGTPVEGSQDPATAPQIGPGQFLDQLPGRQLQKIWYRVPRTQPGSTVHVGITARATSDSAIASVEVDGPDGRYCQSRTGSSYQGLTSAGASSWTSTPTSPCNTADHVLVGVSAPGNHLLGATFELVVSEEPPLVDDRGLPPVEKPTWQPMPQVRAVAAPVPGASLSDAPVLAPGAYTSSILSGETQVFAVDLDWGQRLQVEMVVAPRRGALAEALGVGDVLNVQLLGADRGKYGDLRAGGQPKSDVSIDPDTKPYVRTATTAEIRYLNRTDVGSGSEPGAVPGRQYVVLSKNRFVAKTPFLVPYTLTVSVTGTAGQGAPAYLEATANVPPGSATSPGTASPAPADASPPPVSGTRPGVPVSAVLGVAGAALALGAVATAAAVLFHRRRRSTIDKP